MGDTATCTAPYIYIDSNFRNRNHLSMSNTESAVFLSHIVSQIRANVDFLVEQNCLSSTDADAFIAKLPSSSPRAVVGVPVPRALPPRAPALPQRSQQVKARAMWAYNENNEVCNLVLSRLDGN